MIRTKLIRFDLSKSQSFRSKNYFPWFVRNTFTNSQTFEKYICFFFFFFFCYPVLYIFINLPMHWKPFHGSHLTRSFISQNRLTGSRINSANRDNLINEAVTRNNLSKKKKNCDNHGHKRLLTYCRYVAITVLNYLLRGLIYIVKCRTKINNNKVHTDRLIFIHRTGYPHRFYLKFQTIRT